MQFLKKIVLSSYNCLPFLKNLSFLLLNENWIVLKHPELHGNFNKTTNAKYKLKMLYQVVITYNFYVLGGMFQPWYTQVCIKKQFNWDT